LLRMVDAKLDQVGGEWSVENGVLVSGKEEWARCQLPYTPPDEYDLLFVVDRREGGDALGFGLAQGKTTFGLWIDGHPARGCLTGIDRLDGMVMEDSPATVKGKFLTNNKPSTIVISVRKSGVSVNLDGKGIFSWQGDYKRLSKSPVCQWKDAKAPLLVGGYG